MNDSRIDPARTAVLIMHYQNDIFKLIPGAVPVIKNTRALLSSARKNDLKVIFIRMGFSAGYPEVNPRNRSGMWLKSTGLFVNDQIHADVAPQSGEAIVTARRVNPFFGTELEILLETAGIDTLVMAGVQTTGVVLSGVSHASDADYRIFCVKDCCYDPDPVVHDHLVATGFTSRANCLSQAEMQAIIARA
ncbi:cysteine hydrolase [Glaciimonas sp. PCH181]|nr:isochorismatase family cysteine hydrolase [Glaciimonas sp. PCH181]PUA20616.1 cysteine hydrolase [Glaciimonas sp. PCH181]